MIKQLFNITRFVFLLFVCNSVIAQSTIRVPSDYPKIQQALNAAKENTTILVSPGTYYENIVWPKNIDGIKLIGIEGSSKTIIDGGKNGRVVKIEGDDDFYDKDYKISKATVLKGLTIQNGKVLNLNGCGLYCRNAAPTLNDLVISNNESNGVDILGSGAYLYEYYGEIENCIFLKNEIIATNHSFGSGLYLIYAGDLEIRNCTFERNKGTSTGYTFGGGLYLGSGFDVFSPDSVMVSLVKCKFLNNTTRTGSYSYGAGVYWSHYDEINKLKNKIDSCLFLANNVGIANYSSGGGLHTDADYIKVSNSHFINNYAENGAGIFFASDNNENSLLIVNNSIFSRNEAIPGNTSGGSAIFTAYRAVTLELTNVVTDNNTSSPINIDAGPSKAILQHCTVFSNEKKCNFFNNKVNAINTIIWNKPDKEYTSPNPNHTYTHSIIKGGYTGTGNINSDPLMLDPHLPVPGPQSPCFNAGKLISDITTDINGYPRVIPTNSLPDIGAYEMDQYFAHALVKFYYDVNKNGSRDGQERYLTFGSVVDQSGQEHVNFNENGRYIILKQGKTVLKYNPASNETWNASSQSTFDLDVNKEDFSETIEIGLYPKEINSQVSSNVIGDNFRCGEEVRFSLTITNYGTTIESGTAYLDIDDRLDTFRFVTQPDEKISSHRYAWQYRDLYPGESITFEFYVTAPRITLPEQLGEFYAFCHGVSDITLRDDDCYFAELRCSFDPNDKFSIPQREDHLSLIDKPLNYTIRFQNTGNDYARNVIIRDTIDASFDLRTFKIINTSHPNVLNVSINPNREIVFAFNNIFLPDSTTNLIGSNGHVMYTLDYVNGIIPNTEVHNTANIFFDFNPPIVTNTTKNIVVTAFPSSTENMVNTDITIYPNPAQDELNFSKILDDISLYDIKGQLIKKHTDTNKISINVNPGLYVLKLTLNGQASLHKVVVSKN